MIQQKIDENVVDAVNDKFSLDNHDSQINQFEKPQKKKIKRVSQPLLTYFLVLIVETALVTQVVLYLYISPDYAPYVIVIIWTAFSILIWTISSLQLAQWSDIWRIALSLDSIIYMELGADVGHGLFQYFFYDKKGQWFTLVAIIDLIILNFVYACNFRVMVRFAKWQQWQVILYKIQKMLTAMFYLGISAPIFLDKLSFVSSDSDQAQSINSKIRSLYLLFTIGYFTFLYEMHNVICDFDGSADMTPTYILKSPDQDDQE